MPTRRYILTALVAACILGAGFFASREIADPLAQKFAIVCAVLFALGVVRSSLVRPYLVTRSWFKYANDRGHRAVSGRHGEPRMVGEHDGVRFVIAQSTSMLGGGAGYYARTVVTAAVENDVPDGLRVYRRDALEWMHQLSGLREVELNDPPALAALMVEGVNAEETAAWVRAHSDTFTELAERYPRFISYGAEVDGLPVAAGGASGAVTLIVVGRKSSAAELDTLIKDACRYAKTIGEAPKTSQEEW